MGRQMTPCKRVAKEHLINWIVTRVHRFNLTANSVKRILNVIVDPFVIKIICVFPLEVKKSRPLSKDKGRTPAKTNSFYTLTTSLAIPTYLDCDDENTDQQNELHWPRIERARLSDSSLNPLKKDGLSVRNIGKPQIAFLFAVLLFMSLFPRCFYLGKCGFTGGEFKSRVPVQPFFLDLTYLCSSPEL